MEVDGRRREVLHSIFSSRLRVLHSHPASYLRSHESAIQNFQTCSKPLLSTSKDFYYHGRRDDLTSNKIVLVFNPRSSVSSFKESLQPLVLSLFHSLTLFCLHLPYSLACRSINAMKRHRAGDAKLRVAESKLQKD